MCGFTMTVKVLTVWKLWGHCEMWDMLCFQVRHRPRASGYNQAGLGVSQKWRQPFSSPGPLLFFTLRFTLLKIFLNLSLWIIWKRRYYSEKQSNNHLLMVAWDEYREGTQLLRVSSLHPLKHTPDNGFHISACQRVTWFHSSDHWQSLLLLTHLQSCFFHVLLNNKYSLEFGM